MTDLLIKIVGILLIPTIVIGLPIWAILDQANTKHNNVPK